MRVVVFFFMWHVVSYLSVQSVLFFFYISTKESYMYCIVVEMLGKGLVKYTASVKLKCVEKNVPV